MVDKKTTLLFFLVSNLDLFNAFMLHNISAPPDIHKLMYFHFSVTFLSQSMYLYIVLIFFPPTMLNVKWEKYSYFFHHVYVLVEWSLFLCTDLPMHVSVNVNLFTSFYIFIQMDWYYLGSRIGCWSISYWVGQAAGRYHIE